jgi:serine/threonine protein kinase
MSGSTRRQHDTDGDDALRELLSSILSGRYTEETYLWDVSSVCRARPEAVPRLLALIDRYKRIGRMPAEQYAKIRTRIEQVLEMIQPAVRPAGATPHLTSAVASSPPIDVAMLEDDEEENSRTSELVTSPPDSRPPPKPAQPATAAETRVLAQSMELGPVPERGSRTSALTRIIGGGATRLVPAQELPAAASAAPPRAAPGIASPAVSARAPASAGTPIGVGTVLHDRYELNQLLGRGGIATVYKAVDRYRVNLGLEDCYVAVKIVQPHPSRPGSVAALGREFHNAQLLSHPNVINVFNIDHAGEASFYTMELLDGERLSQVVKRLGTLTRRHALAIIRDIGAAVAHAHSRGVVHADLKPHNVMITQTGQVRVLDFGSGIIRAREPWISELSPEDSYRQATPAYASCEQLEGWSADPRDDIYALACLSYLLLTGRHPFNMRPSLEARAQRLRPRRPPDVSGESWRALRRGLSWTRDQRTVAVEEWLRDLGVDKATETLPPLSLLAAHRPAAVWVRRAAAATIVAGGLAFAAALAAPDWDWQQILERAQSTLDGAWQGLSQLADTDESPQTPAVSLPPLPSPSPVVTHKTIDSLPHYARGAAPAVASEQTVGSTTGPHDPVARERAPDPSEKAALTPPIIAADAGQPRGAAANSSGTAALPPRLEFSAPSYVVPSTEPAARIVIRRNGSTEGDLNFVWWTEEASAKADVDYASLGRRVERIPSGSDRITIYVPIISTPQRRASTQFYVALSEPGSEHSAGPGSRSLVTIDHGG